MRKAAKIIKSYNFKYPDIILSLCSRESNARDKPPYAKLKNVINPHDRFKKDKRTGKVVRDYSKPANASYGVCQIQLNTAKTNGSATKAQLMKANINLKFAGLEFTRQLRRYDGNLRKAISAYNAGHAIKSNRAYVDDVLIRATHFKHLFK